MVPRSRTGSFGACWATLDCPRGVNSPWINFNDYFHGQCQLPNMSRYSKTNDGVERPSFITDDARCMNHNRWSSVKTNHDGVKLSVECSNHNSGVMCKTNQLYKQISEQDVPRSCPLYLNSALRLIIIMFQEAGTPQVLNPISHRAYSHHSLRQLLHLGYWSPNSLTPPPPPPPMESP